MKKHLVPLNDLSQDGKTFDLSDQETWLDPLREFKMDCRITTPFKMTAQVLPATDGCLVRGQLSGAVVVPCNRCMENATVNFDSSFDEFEEIPVEGSDAYAASQRGEGHVIFEKGVPMLNLDEVAWEQFMLSMPVRPLCKPDCKGLCPQCGANLNLGPCDCKTENTDDRMAALRDVKISRQ